MTAATTTLPSACSQAEFARINGWGKSYVTKLKLEGRLVLDDAGQVRVAESLAAIQATTAAAGRASAPAVSSSTRSDRDRQAFYDAEKSRLDLEERIGRLLQADEVTAALADAAVTLRSTFEAWPERHAAPLAAFGGDEARIQAYLAQHIEAAFGDLHTHFAAIAAQGKRP
jgi:hypothetical protein